MNALDADPIAAEAVALWRERGDFIPHLWNGAIMGTSASIMVGIPLPCPFTAQDFITGMELLGFRFSLCTTAGRPALFRAEPDELPETWDRHALRLLDAFHAQKMTAEAIAFLTHRDGTPGAFEAAASISAGQEGASPYLGMPADPCLDFVSGWNAALAENEATAKGADASADPDAAPDAHWREKVTPFADRANAGDVPIATTAEGAAAALRRALAWDDMEAQDEAMIRAALGFLEGLQPVKSDDPLEGIASLEFEPWAQGPGAFEPLTREGWIAAINPNLVMVRLGHGVLTKTKGELIDAVAVMAEDEDFGPMLDTYAGAVGFFRGHMVLLEAALARLYCAAANVALRSPK